jgi:isochorismate hydrolase
MRETPSPGSERSEEHVAVLVVIEVPGGTSDLDEALTEAWGIESSPPEGNLLRMAGPTDDGWRVVSLWESREQFDAFLENRLHLSLQDAGEDQPVVTFWQIEKVQRFS